MHDQTAKYTKKLLRDRTAVPETIRFYRLDDVVMRPLMKAIISVYGTTIWYMLVFFVACAPAQIPRAVPIATDAVTGPPAESAYPVVPPTRMPAACDTPGLEGFLGEPSRPVDILWNVLLTDPECIGYPRERKSVDFFEQRSKNLDATIDSQLREMSGK